MLITNCLLVAILVCAICVAIDVRKIALSLELMDEEDESGIY